MTSLIDADLVVYGERAIPITGLSSHSSDVAPGHLFIAKRGGAAFVEAAVRAGAVALAGEEFLESFASLPQLIARDIGALEVALAHRFYERPQEKLFLIGVTGTAGKTTTCHAIHYLFEQLGVPCGCIGSLGPTMHTTPDVVTNHALLYRMVKEGCGACAMEVSSIGLDQKRTSGLEFDIALFTNLTHEHLDYHKTMQAYGEAKAKLFSALRPGAKPYDKTGIVNADDPFSRTLARVCPARVRTYGMRQDAHVRGEHMEVRLHGLTLGVREGQEAHVLRSRLLGRHNAYNLLAAISALRAWGAPLCRIVSALEAFPGVPGRLERVPNAAGKHIFVDYAHKEHALANVLRALREQTPGRLITVFGCGGDRDVQKRPKMAAVAERLSDLVIVTNDNPRTEDPEKIAADILRGFKVPGRVRTLLDRREAIHQAIKEATSEDIVLIAGKGHEKGQIFSDRVEPFDDVEVAKE